MLRFSIMLHQYELSTAKVPSSVVNSGFMVFFFPPCGNCAELKFDRVQRDLRGKQCRTVQADNRTSCRAFQSQAAILTLVES